MPPSKLRLPMSGATAAYAERRGAHHTPSEALSPEMSSPMRIDIHHNMFKAHPSLLEQMPEEEWSDVSFEMGDAPEKSFVGKKGPFAPRKAIQSPVREILGDKENMQPV